MSTKLSIENKNGPRATKILLYRAYGLKLRDCRNSTDFDAICVEDGEPKPAVLSMGMPKRYAQHPWCILQDGLRRLPDYGKCSLMIRNSRHASYTDA